MAKSVLSFIPIYSMHTQLLPKGTCDQIDKIIHTFVWGGCDDKKKVHLVNWGTLCRPKKKGGLGLKNMHDILVSGCQASMGISS